MYVAFARVVQRHLTKDTLRAFLQAVTLSPLAGAADTQTKQLQSVQNTAVRVVSGAQCRDHIASILRSLHWVPLRQRVTSGSLFLCGFSVQEVYAV